MQIHRLEFASRSHMLETLIEVNQPARGKLYSFSRYCRINEYSFNTLPSSHYLDGLLSSKWCFR